MPDPDERILIAHLLRRTGFGPHPGRVEALVGGGTSAAIDSVLTSPALAPGDHPSFREGDDDPARRWLGLMVRPDAGLHEKMVWFWHGHLTSSEDKVGSWRMLYQQHLLLRQHALGNFRELLQAVTVDPAMLVYLDGDGSTADAPNENYAREVMELFTLGRGRYNQDDVRGAAHALAGWSVDYDKARASFDPTSGPTRSVGVLGRQVNSAADVVDVLCDHPACALWVSERLYRFLVGESPAPDVADLLARRFRSSGLEIRPLVEDVLRRPEFLQTRGNRPRYPVEWAVATATAFGTGSDTGAILDACTLLNQVPYQPPSVAGWPWGNGWLSASSALAHAARAIQGSQVANAPGVTAVRRAADPVGAALDRCSLFEMSPSTWASLKREWSSLARATDIDDHDRAATLLATVISTPEFSLT
ncbi:MAG: DUF1800 domain-containing protein [Actinomycetota bacterium]|nr:DUF1800 domain-containing protein [Actinomycetota bacterium]